MSALVAKIGTGLFWFLQVAGLGIPLGVGIAIGAGAVVILVLKFVTWRNNSPEAKK